LTEIVSTKIIEVAPQFIFLNKTETTLLLQQTGTNTVHQVAAGTRQPYHWENGELPKFVQFRPDHQNVEFSPRFSLHNVGLTFVQCAEGNTTKHIYKVTKRQVNQSIFCVIEHSKHPPYMIHNKLKDYQIRVQQADIQGALVPIPPGGKLEFAW
jgi:hypothetical protein